MSAQDMKIANRIGNECIFRLGTKNLELTVTMDRIPAGWPASGTDAVTIRE